MNVFNKANFKYHLCITLLLPTFTFSEEIKNNEPVNLPPLKITENIENQPLPYISIVNSKTLEDRFIKDFGDLAKRSEPGVNFNRTNQSINIRGLEKDRVLTTVDGIRLPYLDDRIRGEKGGVDTIDFSSLSRLDIIRGSNANRSGSGSLGGSVELYTLNPEDLLKDHKNFGALFKTDYDSADQSYGLNAAIAGQLDGTSWLIQAGKRQGHQLDNKGHRNLYGSNRTTPDPNDTKQSNFLVKLKQELGNGHRIGITGEQFEKTKDIDLRTNQGSTYAINNNDSRENVKRQRISADYQFKSISTDSFLDEASAIIYWQTVEKGNKQQAYRNTRPIGNFMRNNRIQKDMYGTTGDLTKIIVTEGIEQKITLGGEWYQLNAKQTSSGYDNCPIFTSPPSPWDPNFPIYMACSSLHTNQSDMPKTHGQQWALFIADDITFTDARVTLTPALRYDHYKHTPQNTKGYSAGTTLNQQTTLKTSKDSKLSASFTAKWQLADEVIAYARWSQGFKAPDPTELYMNYINTGVGYATLGNAKLKPEESNNFELGVNLGNEQLGGSVNLFYSKYKNFIDSTKVDNATMQQLGLDLSIYRYGVDRWENRNKVRIYGAETTAHWQFADHWKIWSSAAWTVGKDQKTHQYLNSVAPLTGIIGLSYKRDNWGGDVILTTATRRNKVENSTDFKAPGYATTDLTIFWEPTAIKGLRLQAGVFNVLDKKYWNALNIPDNAGMPTPLQPYDYYSEAGRSFRVSATWQY